MGKKISFTALILAASLLSSCGARGEPSLQLEPSARSGDICYVPLDDRPDNLERVEYLANSLGYRLLTPEEDWFATRLDGQPSNANGTQSGDRAALYEWVLEQEAAGCDRYVLFLDQLTSGGLVNSRHMSESQPVTLSDGTVLTESELVESLLTALSDDGNNVVWVLDTVMRLAATTGYAGFGLEGYNALRSYGMEARPELTGEALTVDAIVADYPLAADGTALDAARFSLTEGAVADYLAARERKLRLSDEVQSLLTRPEYAGFRLLLGIDDSSAADSIQKNEIAYLRQQLRFAADGTQLDWLLSGVDDLAFKAVAKLYLDEIGWNGAKAVAHYYGGTEDSPACAYDSQPLNEIVAEHFAFFGLAESPETSSAPQLEILVLTQPADESKRPEYYHTLIKRLNENEAAAVPTVLIDAGNGAYGTAFHEALVKQSHLGFLLSYAGFLDMAIVTGTALAHGVARYAWLADGGGAGADDLANYSFQKSLTESLVLDMAYKHVVRNQVIATVRDTLSGDANNFYAPPIDLNAVTKTLSDGMEKAAAPILKNLSHSNLLVSLNEADGESGANLAGWGKVSLSEWSFPWSRAFEVRMRIDVNDLTKPHKKLLGLFNI